MIFAPPAAQPTIAQSAFLGLLEFNTTAFATKVANFREAFARVWYRQDGVTAQQMFDEAGTGGASFFTSAQAEVQSIATIAQSNGKTLGDYLPPEQYTPPLPYTINNDGTVTVQPPAGV